MNEYNTELYESPEQVSPEQEVVEEQVEQVVEATEPEQDSPMLRRMKAEQVKLRDEKFRLEREKSEMAARLKQLEEAQKATHDPDDLVQRRYVDQRVQELEKQVHKTTSEYKLKMQYPDFDKVVNDATIQALKDKHPSLAMSIGQTYDRDQFNGAAAAYEAIKNMGIYTEDAFAQDRERAQFNANKPRTSQSISPVKQGSPIADASVFANDMKSEEYRNQKYKEMMHFARK